MSAIGNKVALQTPVPTIVFLCPVWEYVVGGGLGGAQRLTQPLYHQGGCAGWVGLFWIVPLVQ